MSIALLFAALFTFTVQVIPIWQAATAIIVILFSLGYLLSKKQFLFEQEEVFESVDTRNEVMLMNEEQVTSSQMVEEIVVNEETSIEVPIVETDNSEEHMDIENTRVNNDISPVEKDRDELADFFEQFDKNTQLNEELTIEHKAELSSLSEVASTKDNEGFPKKDEQGGTDDFLLELFEGRESEVMDEHNLQNETIDPNVDVSPDLNDLFENIMNDTPNKDSEEALNDVNNIIVEAETENSEKVSYEIVETEKEVPIQELGEVVLDQPIQEIDETKEKELSQNEAGQIRNYTHEDENIDLEEPNNNDISNSILNMLLDQLHVYKQVLSATEYEKILQKAIEEAKSEKDCFLFAKELLFYYRQTDNKEKYELLLSDMNEKLRKYPLLIQQLLWIQ